MVRTGATIEIKSRVTPNTRQLEALLITQRNGHLPHRYALVQDVVSPTPEVMEKKSQTGAAASLSCVKTHPEALTFQEVLDLFATELGGTHIQLSGHTVTLGQGGEWSVTACNSLS